MDRRGLRRWTDDQLRSAVATAQTWRGVARALGLSQSATPRLQRHARRLGLSTAHFTGTRRWSDLMLRQVIETSSTWPEVLERLQLSDASETRLLVKGHAVRLGIDLTHLSTPVASNGDELEQLWVEPDLAQLRGAAEAIAVAWFTLRGIPVAVPTQPRPHDLLVSLRDKVARVQVKSTTRANSGSWLAGICRAPSFDKTAGNVPYDPGALDYFWIIDGDGAIYFIPSPLVAGRVALVLRAYSAYRVGNASSLLAAVTRPTEQLPASVG